MHRQSCALFFAGHDTAERYDGWTGERFGILAWEQFFEPVLDLVKSIVLWALIFRSGAVFGFWLLFRERVNGTGSHTEETKYTSGSALSKWVPY